VTDRYLDFNFNFEATVAAATSAAGDLVKLGLGQIDRFAQIVFHITLLFVDGLFDEAQVPAGITSSLKPGMWMHGRVNFLRRYGYSRSFGSDAVGALPNGTPVAISWSRMFPAANLWIEHRSSDTFAPSRFPIFLFMAAVRDAKRQQLNGTNSLSAARLRRAPVQVVGPWWPYLLRLTPAAGNRNYPNFLGTEITRIRL